MFVSAINKLISNKAEILGSFEVVKCTIFNNTALELENMEIKNEMIVVAELIKKCVNENVSTKLNQEEYNKQYEGLATRFEAE